MSSLFTSNVHDENNFGLFRSSLEKYITDSDMNIHIMHLQYARSLASQLDILESSLSDPYAKAYDRSVFAQMLKQYQEEIEKIFGVSDSNDKFDELYKAFTSSQISEDLARVTI